MLHGDDESFEPVLLHGCKAVNGLIRLYNGVPIFVNKRESLQMNDAYFMAFEIVTTFRRIGSFFIL